MARDTDFFHNVTVTFIQTRLNSEDTGNLRVISVSRWKGWGASTTKQQRVHFRNMSVFLSCAVVSLCHLWSSSPQHHFQPLLLPLNTLSQLLSLLWWIFPPTHTYPQNPIPENSRYHNVQIYRRIMPDCWECCFANMHRLVYMRWPIITASLASTGSRRLWDTVYQLSEMWVKDTQTWRLYEMEKGWRIIPISCKGCEMEWIMGRDNEPLFLVAVGQIFTCYCLERYLRHSKRRQRAWTSLTQGWAESGRNPSAENGSEFRAKGGSKIAGVKEKVRLVLNWSAWRCSNE